MSKSLRLIGTERPAKTTRFASGTMTKGAQPWGYRMATPEGEKVAPELVHQRTLNSKVFDVGRVAGRQTFTTEAIVGPRHYRERGLESSDPWLDVDLHPADICGLYHVQNPTPGRPAFAYRSRDGGDWVLVELLGVPETYDWSTYQDSEGRRVWPEVWPGVDVELRVWPDRLGIFKVIKRPDARHQFAFRVLGERDGKLAKPERIITRAGELRGAEIEGTYRDGVSGARMLVYDRAHVTDLLAWDARRRQIDTVAWDYRDGTRTETVPVQPVEAYPLTVDTDVSEQVSSDADDGKYAPTGEFDTLGHPRLGGYQDPRYSIFARWASVPVPPGAEVSVGLVRYTVSDNEAHNLPTRLSLNDVGDAVAPTSAAEAENAARGSARAWVIPYPYSVSRIDTPDIADLVQEVITRPDWVSGNAMMLLHDCITYGGELWLRGYDSFPNYGARLLFSWAPPAPPSGGAGAIMVIVPEAAGQKRAVGGAEAVVSIASEADGQKRAVGSAEAAVSIGEPTAVTIASDLGSGYATAHNNGRKLARAPSGRWWAVFQRRRSTWVWESRAAYSDDDGESWMGEEFSAASSFEHRPAIAVDRVGNVHVVWSDEGTTQYRQRTAAGWQPQETVADRGRASSIAVDAAGNVHVAWRGDWNIQYRKRTTSGWGPQESVADRGVGGVPHPSLAVDAEGVVHVAWADLGWGTHADNNNIQYRKRTASGWQPQEALTDTAGGQGTPSLAVDAEGVVHVAWHGHGWGARPAYANIQYRQQTSSGWGPREPLTDVPDYQYFPSIAVDTAGDVHVVWEGDGWGASPWKSDIQYRKRTSSGWGPREDITDAAWPQNQERPSLCDGLDLGYALVWTAYDVPWPGNQHNVKFLRVVGPLGHKQAQGVAELTVSVGPEGGGHKATFGSATATVAISVEGAGSRATPAGGAEATVAVAPEASGLKRGQGAAEPAVALSAEAAGTKASRGSAESATVTVGNGAGIRTTADGSILALAVSPIGAGTKAVAAGAATDVIVMAAGAGTEAQQGSGGAAVSVAIAPEGLGHKVGAGASQISPRITLAGVGAKRAAGDAQLGIVTSVAGAGTISIAGGAEATVSIVGVGVGTKQASDAAAISVGISPRSIGIKSTAGAGETSAIIYPEAAGLKNVADASGTSLMVKPVSDGRKRSSGAAEVAGTIITSAGAGDKVALGGEGPNAYIIASGVGTKIAQDGADSAILLVTEGAGIVRHDAGDAGLYKVAVLSPAFRVVERPSTFSVAERPSDYIVREVAQ